MYQLQNLNIKSRLTALANTEYPVLVIEPGFNLKGSPYKTQKIVHQLRRTPLGKTRILLAYIDIGQAEDFRDYWHDDWVAPTKKKVGYPRYILSSDPDNWGGDYQVAYWNPAWKNLWLGRSGIIAKIAQFGFDGVYLDWVGAYDEPSVKKAGKADGVKVETEMITFIEELGAAGKQIKPDFLVVPQNASYLLDADPKRYIAAIDGLAVEDTWWKGDGDASWDSPRAGDIKLNKTDRKDRRDRIHQYKKYLKAGLPVFSVDYCIKKNHAAQVYRKAKKHGLIPLVTRVSLDRLTLTPPPQN